MAAFNEELYRAGYASVDNLLTNGLPAPDGVVYTTALDYYNGYGKFQSGLEGFFTGDSGNNFISGSGPEVQGYGGVDVDLYGIGYTVNILTPTSVEIIPESLGEGEKDVLVGRTAQDIEDGFFLSALDGTYTDRSNLNNPVTGNSSPLYVGEGNEDKGLIKNFTIGKDYVSLSGPPADYNYEYAKNGNFRIFKDTGSGKGDLVGVVTGGPFDLQVRRFLNDDSFRLSARVLRRGFNEELYLKINNLEATVSPSDALNHYVTTGQFSKDITAIFTGAEKGTPVSFSSSTADGNDTLIAYGRKNTMLSGVGILVKEDSSMEIESGFGANQVDVLIGGLNTKDNFMLGVGDDLNATDQSFYVGGGDLDYARIQNYQTKDQVILAGETGDYTYTSVGSNVEIRTLADDLIGIVENVSGVATEKTLSNGTFAASFSVI